MLGVLLAAASLAAQPAPPQVPELSSLSSVEFKLAVREVVRELAASRFEEAAQRAAVLPRLQVRVQWDDSAVPVALKSIYAAARDEAFAAWATSAVGVRPALSSTDPDVKISFAPTLPAPADSALRQAAVFFQSYAPGEPRVEAVVALRRGEDQREAGRRDISSETAYAIGAFLGLARLPREGGAMGRTDTPSRLPATVLPEEALAVRANVEAADALRRLAREKKPLPAPEQPAAFVDAKSLSVGEALQGGPMRTSFEVVNRGRTPLIFNIVPDCSCFILRYTRTVQPGQTTLVQVGINTRDFPGPLDKALYIYTNDPEWEPRRIPVRGRVHPVYRFLWAEPKEVLLVEDKPVKATVFVVHPDEREWLITGAAIGGVKGSATWAPFEGILADPEFDDPARTRIGHEVTVTVQPPAAPGRYFANITLSTTDPDWPRMERGFVVQRGIIALPGTIFFGQIPAKPAAAWTLLTRPGRGFKVTRVTSSSSSFTAKATPQPNGDVRIDVAFTGQAPPGRLDGRITAFTNDPKQPQVAIPIQGTIK